MDMTGPVFEQWKVVLEGPIRQILETTQSLMNKQKQLQQAKQEAETSISTIETDQCRIRDNLKSLEKVRALVRVQSGAKEMHKPETPQIKLFSHTLRPVILFRCVVKSL